MTVEEEFDIREDGVLFHEDSNMRVATRPSSDFAGSVPLLRVAARMRHNTHMSGEPKIDLKKLRALIVENTGPGKKWSRRSLSLAASGGRNPDLVRDLMRVDKRHPTYETVAGLCEALGEPIANVVRGAPTLTPDDDWMTVAGAVQAGVWREQAEWSAEDAYRVKVGPPTTDGERFGLAVEGRSMDRTIPPGTVLECVRLIGSGMAPASGDYVIAERVRAGLYERTVKRLLQRDDGTFQLVGESTLPEFNEPIFIGRPSDGAFGDDETRVIALVLKAHLVLHASLRKAS